MGLALMVALLLVYCGLSVATGHIADVKGHGFFFYATVALFLPLVTMVWVLLLPDHAPEGDPAPPA